MMRRPPFLWGDIADVMAETEEIMLVGLPTRSYGPGR